MANLKIDWSQAYSEFGERAFKKDYQSGYRRGYRRGYKRKFREGQRNTSYRIAHKLLEDGCPPAKAAELTILSIDEIRKSIST